MRTRETDIKMKDTNCKICLPNDHVHKDVVVIGNGPSGITLSYMLAGHWPHWMPEKIHAHPDELLRARLTYADSTKSLVEQDLVMLADGLEGRSTNPVSLLLDSLQNPCADLGMDVPSMLHYKYYPEKEIDHVVLGKGAPGGSWHRMDPNLRTLSLSAWMSLPGLDFNTWDEREIRRTSPDEGGRHSSGLKLHNDHNNNHDTRARSKCVYSIDHSENETPKLHVNPTKIDTRPTVDFQVQLNSNRKNAIYSNHIVPSKLPRRILSVKRQMSKEVQTRALVSRVAEYYESYVKEMNLSKYFCNDTLVTSIRPIHGAGDTDDRWLVSGVRLNGKPFSYSCRNVVLSNGASDLANRLGLRGENLATSWIKHDLPQLESALEQVTDAERSRMKPVLVVGAGLSAADAVTICRSSGIPVVHVYRNRSAGLDKMLPETVYPEYHEVHKMMKDFSNPYYLYTPLPEHCITEFSLLPTSIGSMENSVTVRHLTTGETRTLEVSFCAILIGFRPDLRFLAPVIKPLVKHHNNTYNNNSHKNVDDQNKCDNLIMADDNNASEINDELLSTNPIDQHFQNNQQQCSLLSKKITWLKNLCAKCKHLNLCEWSRRNECMRKIYSQQYNRSSCTCNNNYSSIHSVSNNALSNHSCTNDGLQFVPVEIKDSIQSNNLSAIGLGEDPTKPIDCKTNPIAVDKFTNKVLRTPKGLYAMGPLVGDNFIRFIPGGSLAITSALHKEND